MTGAPGGAGRLALLRAVRDGLGLVCAALLVAMMLVTVADVVGRYLLSAPIPGASELTELLLAGTIFIGLTAVGLDDAHVTVGLLTDRLPAWTVAPRVLVVRVIAAVVLALVAWRLWVHAGRLASYDEVTIYLRLPLAPAAYAMAGLCALAAALTASLVVLGTGEAALSDAPAT